METKDQNISESIKKISQEKEACRQEADCQSFLIFSSLGGGVSDRVSSAAGAGQRRQFIQKKVLFQIDLITARGNPYSPGEVQTSAGLPRATGGILAFNRSSKDFSKAAVRYTDEVLAK